MAERQLLVTVSSSTYPKPRHRQSNLASVLCCDLLRTCQYTESISPEGFATRGCDLVRGDLLIEADYNGRTLVGRIGRSINAPELGRVRDFLLDYSGEPMTTVEQLDDAPVVGQRRP
jgi:hypothetical protein